MDIGFMMMQWRVMPNFHATENNMEKMKSLNYGLVQDCIKKIFISIIHI